MAVCANPIPPNAEKGSVMTTPLRNTAVNTTAGMPVVRGLVWRTARISDQWERCVADTQFGTYEALEWSGGGFGGTIPARGEFGGHGSLAEAINVCQADYEQRILSAINPDFLSELDTARAEIERLGNLMAPEATVAAVKGHMLCMEAFGEMERRALTAESALTAAQERIAELEGALKPFAKCAEHYARNGYNMKEAVINQTTWGSDGTTAAVLTRGDFRDAAATLSPAVKDPK